MLIKYGGEYSTEKVKMLQIIGITPVNESLQIYFSVI